MLSELQFYIPDDIPPEVLAYEAELKQLKVGIAGKIGALMLKLEKDPESQKTVVKDQYSKVPLYTQRALYLEESLPSMAYMYIISPSGGVLQGDRYRMDITLTNNAYAHITTQGATRIYRMDKNFATQIVNVTVDDGCYFEFIPDQIIPYKDSRFYQKVNLAVHDNATMIYSEMLVPGRMAHDEFFEYDILYMKAAGKNQNGLLRFIDVGILEPKKRLLKTLGLLGPFDIVATVYVLTRKEHVQKLRDSINTSMKNFTNISAGATLMPRNSGVIVRMLGNTTGDLRTAIFEIVRICRKAILNASFSGIRKG